MNRLTQSTDPTLGLTRFGYDPNGNLLTVTDARDNVVIHTYDLMDRLADTATYDAANRQLTFGDKVMTFDANGNLTSIADATGVTTFTWDPRNRLASLSGPGTTASFTYDPLGRRIAKTVDGSTTQYLYDSLDIVQELTAQGPTTYLRSLNIDEPLVRNDSEFYLTDALGSILALTDSTGTLVTRYTYDPFGQTAVEDTASANPLQFTGREHDGPTGLYSYRARYYSPTLHRFLSEDPIGFIGGDVNLYAYALNNPLAFNDPTGEILPQLAIGVLIGGGAGALSAVMNGQNVLVGAGIGAASGAAAALVGPAGAAAVNAIANGFTQLASGSTDLNLTSAALAAASGAAGKLIAGALTGAGVSLPLAQTTAGVSFTPIATGLSTVIGKTVPLRLSNLPVPPPIPPSWLPFPPPYPDPSLGQPIGGFPWNRLGGRK